MSSNKSIVGRYAPSPTGDLHFGNLRTALLAWLHARLQGGRFLLRMEDLDTPRVVAGSAQRIIDDLRWLGIDWDGEIINQSARQSFYQAALERLQALGMVYPCYCSRKDIQEAASAPHNRSGVYPGSCAKLTSAEAQAARLKKTPALRVRLNASAESLVFNDGCLGQQQHDLVTELGDFVIKRADGLFAYQLAVIVDDVAQGVSEVVRGADLIDSTARQIYLARCLGLSAPNYSHVPLMLDQDGQRMAKRNGALSVRSWREAGGSAEQLVADLALSIGLVEKAEPISVQQLFDALNYQQLCDCLLKMP